MDTKHTRGDWHANAIAKGRIIGDEHAERAEKIQICANNCTVATVYRAADATLIKAAPDLADALRDMLTDAETMIEPFRNEALCERARAALAKAGLA